MFPFLVEWLRIMFFHSESPLFSRIYLLLILSLFTWLNDLWFSLRYKSLWLDQYDGLLTGRSVQKDRYVYVRGKVHSVPISFLDVVLQKGVYYFHSLCGSCKSLYKRRKDWTSGKLLMKFYVIGPVTIHLRVTTEPSEVVQ